MLSNCGTRVSCGKRSIGMQVAVSHMRECSPRLYYCKATFVSDFNGYSGTVGQPVDEFFLGRFNEAWTRFATPPLCDDNGRCPGSGRMKGACVQSGATGGRVHCQTLNQYSVSVPGARVWRLLYPMGLKLDAWLLIFSVLFDAETPYCLTHKVRIPQIDNLRP